MQKGASYEGYSLESTSIESVAYDLQAQILVIVFRKGPIYRYLRVPEEVYRDLMEAPSKGRFFLSKIKGVYEHEKII